MRVNRVRLGILIALLLLGVGAGAAVYRVYRSRSGAAALFTKAQRLLDAGDRDGALMALEQVLRRSPSHAAGHFLKGKLLLRDRDPATIRRGDAEGIAAIACFVQATRCDPGFIEGHQLLARYFNEMGAVADALVHAEAALKRLPEDVEANRIAAKGYLQQRRLAETTRCVDRVLARERPVRPHSVLLATQLAEIAGRDSDWVARAEELWKALDHGQSWPTLDDRMALAELLAIRSPSDSKGQTAWNDALDRLDALVVEAADEAAARRLLQTAGRLRQRLGNQALDRTAAVRRLDRFEDSVCERAIGAGALDAGFYLASAARRRAAGRADDAVDLLEIGIQRAVEAGPEVRQSFLPCDLWLTEHYLSRRQFGAAEPHLERLDEHPGFRGWGRLFAGYRFLERGELEESARAFAEAVERLPENGAAHALFGVCQLRRGRLTEGRKLLEQGIRLGASEPLYQAWLAVALSEAGRLEQAAEVARTALADSSTRGLAHALAGQLAMRAGRFADVETELRAALLEAEESFRPALRLALAELAFARGEPAKGESLVRELQDTAYAADALAIPIRHRLRLGDRAGAEASLADARRQFPDSLPLLVLWVNLLADTGRQGDAAAALRELLSRRPKTLVAYLLLADLEDRRGAAGDAFAALEAAEKAFPDDPIPRAAIVDRLIAHKRTAEARALLTRLQANGQLAPAALACLAARLALAEEDLEAASAIVRQASGRHPDEPILKFLEGQLAARSGDWSLAAACFRQSHAAGAFAQRSLRLLFESLLRTGATGEAADLLATGLPMTSVNSLRRRIVWLLARQPLSPELDRQVDRLLQNTPGDADFVIGSAALVTAGKVAKAEQVLAAGREAHPNSIPLIEQAVLLALSQKRQPEAERLLTEALARHPEASTLWTLSIHLDLAAGRLEHAEKTARARFEQAPNDSTLGILVLEITVRRGRWNEALQLAERLAQVTQRPAPSLLALAAAAAGNRGKALELAAEAANAQPHDDECVHQYFRLLAETEDGEALDGALDRLLPQRPGDALLWTLRLERAVGRNDGPAAEDALERVARAPNGPPFLDYCRGLTALAKDELETAERCLMAAAAVQRTQGPATLQLARLRLRQQRLADAMTLVENLHRRQPYNLAALLLHAQLLAQAGEPERAEAQARAALALRPDSSTARLLLAQVLARQPEDDARRQAAALAQEGLQRRAEAPEELEAYLRILLDLGETDRVRRHLELLPARRGELRLAAARACLAGGLAHEAGQQAERVLAEQPDSLDAAWVRADSLLWLAERSGAATDFEQAAECYRTTLRLHPGHLPSANNLAWVVGVHLQNPHRAVEELARAGIRGTDLPPELLDTLGVLHWKMDHPVEAQSYLEAAVARRPTSAVSHYHLGQVYETLGRSRRARQAFERAARLDPTGPWAAKAPAPLADPPAAND